MTEAADRWSVNLIGELLLDRYRVDRTIGAGGMANVYLAQDEQLEIPVVVKVPHTAFLADAGFRERFQRETRDLVTLQHPHIVSILARGEHEGLPFLVMQFLQGGSFGDRLRKAKGKPMPWPEIEPWVRDVARALDFIHDQGVVHRDIKPDNVLFDEYGHGFLSDFGIAKAVGGVDTGLTVTGTTPGSPAYMAPEQPRTNALTGSSDQYSLAATLYEALTGRPTFEGETAVDVLIQKQSEVPTRVDVHAPDVPPAVGAAIMRGLARKPEERFPSCAAMVDAMYETTSPTAAARPIPAPAPPPPMPEPAPVIVDELPTQTRSTGSTATLGGGTRALWVVFAVLIGGPLVFFMAGREGDDAQAPPSHHTGSAPDSSQPKEGPPAFPSRATREELMAALVGSYELDQDALREQIKTHERKLPPRKGVKPRMLPVLRDLIRMKASGFALTLNDDGTFSVSFRGRGDVPQTLRGTWTPDGDLLRFVPEPSSVKGPGEDLSARPAAGGLYLIRRGHQVFLKRQ